MSELTGNIPVGPSSIHSPIYFEKPRELSADEIERLMREAADRMDFEQAIKLRDILKDKRKEG